MPPFPNMPPQGALSSMPTQGPPPQGMPPGPQPSSQPLGAAPAMPPQGMPPSGPQMPPGGPLGQPPGPSGPPPGIAHAGAQAPSTGMPKQPGNEGLINRVLGLIRQGTRNEPPPTNITDQLRAMNELGLNKPGGPSDTPPPNDSGGGDFQMSSGRQDNGHMDMIRHLLGGMGGQGAGASPMGFARGGFPQMMSPMVHGMPMRSFARGGPDFVHDDGHGTGRSDHIEARLSPGEFVMDAETTALLGDGDSAAGARKLEELRQSIRRHKGRKLAEGKFSPDAKDPTSYLPRGALS